ncbi:MAG: alginate export family protein [Bacteroidetes bacterium]|nr:alginate export family protein [Bacteroidota bacterium]
MKQQSKITFMTVCLLTMLSMNVKAQFNISAEFRPRLEYRDGYSRLRDSSQTPYLDILGRNRLMFDYKNDRFAARFSLQHAYVFGENNYSFDTITRNTVNIYEAWFQYNFIKAFDIKIGRMELVYDDGRLLGNSNWRPQAATHDVALVQWAASDYGYSGDFGFAINNTAPAGAFLTGYPLKNYKYMGYLYEQKKFLKDKLTISMMAILDAFQKPTASVTTKTTSYTTLYVTDSNHDTIGTTIIPTVSTSTVTTAYPTRIYGRFTIGGTATYINNNLKIFGAGYYQAGHFNNGKTISAGFFGGYLSYKVLKPLTLLVGYEKLSGNDFSDTTGQKTKSTSFSTLYGTSHGFYGYMDMFSNQVTSGTGAGLTDLYVRATVSLTGKTSIEATWRMFGISNGYLPATVKKPGDLPYLEVGKNLGSEIDLMFVYKPFSNFEVNTAYCLFLPTSSMERLNGLKPGTSKYAQYAYIMLTYKPNFFNSDKH